MKNYVEFKIPKKKRKKFRKFRHFFFSNKIKFISIYFINSPTNYSLFIGSKMV